MTWLTIPLLAFAASLDCLIIGFNYGVKGVRIGWFSNGFIALVCFAGTFLSMLAGRMLGCVLQSGWAEITGGLLFAILGLWMLWGALKPRPGTARKQYSENPEMVDKDSSKVIELRESLLIGLLLCLNNIGIGVGGGMAGIPVLATPALCAVLSFALIGLGCAVGRRIESPRLSRTLELISAILILLLGLKSLLH